MKFKSTAKCQVCGNDAHSVTIPVCPGCWDEWLDQIPAWQEWLKVRGW